MQKLTAEQVQAALDADPGWSLRDGKLEREWVFPDFLEAIKFVNQVADIAEDEGHHPDIDVRYNRVRLALITHDAGGITQNDAAMAARLNRELAP